jgi:hypothetical protein
MYSAIVGREMSALKAVAEGMLMRARRQQRTPTRPRALMGILKPGWT